MYSLGGFPSNGHMGDFEGIISSEISCKVFLSPAYRRQKDMPPLSTSLSESDGWVTVEDDFVLFWVSQVTHAGEQMYQSPPCKLNDGIFQIFVVR
jgi:hypothetical protein